MKKIIIVCEGQTEQKFCKSILQSYFLSKGIAIEFPLIQHSAGGIVKWEYLKIQIENHLMHNEEDFVTTFVDFYGIETHHEFLNWENMLIEADKNTKMDILESGMKNDIDGVLQARFLPYIQLHEFEGLVFSKFDAFLNYYEATEANFTALEQICNDNPNPEMINDSPTTAPSKRLMQYIPRYNKTTDGIELLKSTGLATVRNKCPRFDSWMNKLEAI
jgi:hypothetical protein